LKLTNFPSYIALWFTNSRLYLEYFQNSDWPQKFPSLWGLFFIIH